jgi:hypothetical protein
MKRIAGILGVALALGGIDRLAAGSSPWGAIALGTTAGQVAAASPISKDDPGNTDDDSSDEGTGVVDPVPQDDGSDGVDDGTGDAS